MSNETPALTRTLVSDRLMALTTQLGEFVDHVMRPRMGELTEANIEIQGVVTNLLEIVRAVQEFEMRLHLRDDELPPNVVRLRPRNTPASVVVAEPFIGDAS